MAAATEVLGVISGNKVNKLSFVINIKVREQVHKGLLSLIEDNTP